MSTIVTKIFIIPFWLFLRFMELLSVRPLKLFSFWVDRSCCSLSRDQNHYHLPPGPTVSPTKWAPLWPSALLLFEGVSDSIFAIPPPISTGFLWVVSYWYSNELDSIFNSNLRRNGVYQYGYSYLPSWAFQTYGSNYGTCQERISSSVDEGISFWPLLALTQVILRFMMSERLFG
jgi:hypothetical protein